MIRLTDEYTRMAAARAVPGSYWDPEDLHWVLDDDVTPRAAAVALQLFPHLTHEHPELLELREQLIRDVKPVDYATPYAEAWVRSGRSLDDFGPRVAAAMRERGMAWHEYQKVDGLYLSALLDQTGGAYLGWDRGLGKTLETAGIIDTLGLRRCLVVAPNTSKTSVWADELGWALPQHDIVVLPNDKAKRERLLDTLRTRDDAFVLVVHYEALGLIAGTRSRGKNKPAEILNGWRTLGTWDIKVLDEGHRVSNGKSIQSRAARKVPARMRLLLSGSTFQNQWEELFPQLKFLRPQTYSNKQRDFVGRFLDQVEGSHAPITIGILPERADQLQDELGRVGVWRFKQAKAIESTVEVDLSPAQRQVYDDLAETLLAELPDGETIRSGAGVALITRLRQVTAGLDTLSRNVVDSSKMDAVIETVRQGLWRGDDFLIFVWYKEQGYALQRRIADAVPDVPCRFISGDQKHGERADIIRASIADVESGRGSIVIGTISTMGESVNMQHLNHVIMADQSFNPALNQQAVDRVDRQGQTRVCYLTKIIARDTVDAHLVVPRLMNKTAMRAMVFGR